MKKNTFFILLFFVLLFPSMTTVSADVDKGLIGDDSTKVELEEGKTKPIYSTDDAITETVYVETTVDSDGEFDRVAIDITRPKTQPGVKVPVIYTMSPYAGGNNPVEVHDVDRELYPVGQNKKLLGENYSSKKELANVDVDEMQAKDLGREANHYVPRGYATITGYSLGTGKSNGCPTVGDEREISGTTAVIDWLNGRANAFTKDGEEVAADWSTGNVGMKGGSYLGTLPIGAAATGVQGLKTIIPTAAISSWDDYYRANGSVIAPIDTSNQGWDTDVLANYVLTRENPEVCEGVISDLTKNQDRKTGDYNDFWDKRNYI